MPRQLKRIFVFFKADQVLPVFSEAHHRAVAGDHEGLFEAGIDLFLSPDPLLLFVSQVHVVEGCWCDSRTDSSAHVHHVLGESALRIFLFLQEDCKIQADWLFHPSSGLFPLDYFDLLRIFQALPAGVSLPLLMNGWQFDCILINVCKLLEAERDHALRGFGVGVCFFIFDNELL